MALGLALAGLAGIALFKRPAAGDWKAISILAVFGAVYAGLALAAANGIVLAR